ncbi:cell division protein FtsZ [Capnocytophaga sp. Marseille-Q4570]|jgi:cell division protein ftsZ|uniref:Cell division protein FtsZ n=1 Tax=Capnocytophaga bilenii TaxID=2819369 RepID=A0ABS3Q1J0_9FLAO|nr:cell division protein FtsZ [Capnocytophaga bilenii]MBO1884989.1 cell division protein FtsZ [Capnocytophaga bilenii]
MDMEQQVVQFNLPKNNSNYIKIIGVGGGGGNAVNYMFNQGIKGVDYIVCNTDKQDLENSPVPNKVQLGLALTKGLGVGAKPAVGEAAALESSKEIEEAIGDDTEMVFITAGMGGGTGTGAAPVIAKIAKDKGILTVGIVTTPFSYEGPVRSRQAKEGIRKLQEAVDSLIIINNNKITEVYGKMKISESLAKANEILLKGAKGIAELVSANYMVNIDMEDARSVLKDGGTAIMGSATADGEDRAIKAVTAALNSPLLNDNKITGAKKSLLLVVFNTEDEITPEEMEIITNYIQEQAGGELDIFIGMGEDDTVPKGAITVTVTATGFTTEQQQLIVNAEPKRINHVLGENQTIIERDFTEPKAAVVQSSYPIPAVPEIKKEPSLSDLFNIWTDCEYVTADDSFIIVDKTPPKPSTPNQGVSIQESSSNQRHITTEAAVARQVSNDNKSANQLSPTNKAVLTPQYSYNEYMEFERTLRDAKPVPFSENKEANKSEITIHRVETKQQQPSAPVQMTMFDEEELLGGIKPTPENATIDQVLNNNRSGYLSKYNHTFGSSVAQSRTSVAKDSAGDTQLRKNNSYLHDRAD